MARFYTDKGRVIEASMVSMIGRRVRIAYGTSNGMYEFAKGKILTIRGSERGGLSLTGRYCACCGVAPHIRCVDPSNVILLELPAEPDAEPSEPPPRVRKTSTRRSKAETDE